MVPIATEEGILEVNATDCVPLLIWIVWEPLVTTRWLALASRLVRTTHDPVPLDVTIPVVALTAQVPLMREYESDPLPEPPIATN